LAHGAMVYNPIEILGSPYHDPSLLPLSLGVCRCESVSAPINYFPSANLQLQYRSIAAFQLDLMSLGAWNGENCLAGYWDQDKAFGAEITNLDHSDNVQNMPITWSLRLNAMSKDILLHSQVSKKKGLMRASQTQFSKIEMGKGNAVRRGLAQAEKCLRKLCLHFQTHLLCACFLLPHALDY